MKIFISKNGQQLGPYSAEEARQFINSGQLSPNDLACAEGGAQGVPLSSLLGAPPASGAPPVSGSGGGTSKVITILAICLGLFGLLMVGGIVGGYFYLDGKAKKEAEAVMAEDKRMALAEQANREEQLRNAAKAKKETSISNAKEFVRQRHQWIKITQAVQDVFEDVTPEVYILSGPDQLELMTKTVAEIKTGFQPRRLTNATTAVWIESLTTTPPSKSGSSKGGAGGMGGMGGSPDVETVYLKLKAKIILPRVRETLNREFAQKLVERFRSSPTFVDSEEEEGGTVVVGNVPPIHSKEQWFEFTLKMTLTHPIKMQDMEETEFGELGPHLRQFVPEETVDPMTTEEFMVHMANVIEELNKRAREALVQIPLDPTNVSARIPYNFTFMNLRAVPQLAKNKIPELQLQLKDIRTISDVLFQSRVRSIESLQRTRVTHEDLTAGASRDFLDTRPKYTNNVAVVRPYKVRFQCLSGGIAKTLNGFASQKNFFVIRKMEVTQLGTKRSPGRAGLSAAPGAKPKKVLTPQHMAWLVRQGFATTKTTNVISESVLEVELDVDVIRRTSLGGGIPEPLEEPLAGKLTGILSATNQPAPSLMLEGTNHMVFNPRKWKEIVTTNGANPILVRDTARTPLGVSALVVTNITPVSLIVVPRARLALDKMKVLYTFTVTDYYPMQFDARYGLLATFVPHLSMARPASKRLTLVPNRDPEEIHSFSKWPPATLNQLHRDWIVKVNFKDATAPVPPGNVDNVLFNLDVIYTQPNGVTVTNQYPNWRSNAPIGINRARKADFLYKTKYHAPRAYTGYRVGRHIMMDGEAFRVIKITPNEVQLYSDLDFGGNGKLYIKKLINPAAAIAAGANGGDGAAVQPPKK